MADYRQFCSSCGNEIGFGSHKAGCEALARVRETERERREWERAVKDATAELSDDQLVEAMVEYSRRMSALLQEISAMEKYSMALKDEARARGDFYALMERYRKELGRHV